MTEPPFPMGKSKPTVAGELLGKLIADVLNGLIKGFSMATGAVFAIWLFGFKF